MKNRLQKIFSVFIFRLLLSTLYSLLSTTVVEAGIFVISGSSRTFRSVDGASWLEMGSLEAPGAATYCDVCRDALGHLYALRSDGRVYRSEDGGKTWTFRGQQASYTNYDSIIAHPTQGGVLYIMTGDATGTGQVSRSTDGGLTWSTPKGAPATANFQGIAIGRTGGTSPPGDPTPRVYIVTNKGDTWYTNIDLTAGWAATPINDVGKATDYTDFFGDSFVNSNYGFVYVLRDDNEVVISVDGVNSWQLLTNQPTYSRDNYRRLAQDLDIFDANPRNLFALRVDGNWMKTLDGGQTAWTTGPQIAPLTNFTGAGSYDGLLPGVTDYQEGDDTWRKENIATYNVDFYDPSYGTVRRFETRATSLPGGSGTLLDNWSVVVDSINTGSYTTNWKLVDATWANLRESVTNYVSVRVWDNSSNVYVSTDVFYVLKDTTPPGVPGLLAPSDGLTTNYATLTFQWNPVSDSRSGFKEYGLQLSLDAGFGTINYSSTTVNTLATLSIADGVYYWRVRAFDKATNVSTSTVRSFTLDTTPPAAVTNLTAQSGTSAGQVNLFWTAPGDDGSSGTIQNGEFRIQNSTWAGISWSTANAQTIISTSNVTPGSSQSYRIAGLEDRYYYFRLWTRDEINNWSTQSNLAESWAGPDVSSPTWVDPANPGIRDAASTGAGNEIRVQWNQATDARTPPVYYQVYKDTAGYFTWASEEKVYESSSPVAGIGYTYSCIVSGLTDGTTYTFGVRARDSYGSSNIEQNTVTINAYPTDTTAPNNVTAFTCVAVSSGNQIDLSWNNIGGDQAGTRICRKTGSYPANPFDGDLQVSLSTPTGAYSDTNLNDNTTYYYKAFAYDEIPNYSTGTVTSTYPRDTLAPENVTAFTSTAVSSGNQINLSWTNVGGDQAGTMIRWKNTPPAPSNPNDGTLLISSPTTVSTYQHINLQDGVTYYYTAFAYDEVPNYSTGTITSTYPRDTLAPGNVTLFVSSAQPQGNTIKLTWSTATVADTDFQGVRICSSTASEVITSTTGFVIDLPASTTYYLDTNLNDGVTYYYKIFSYDEVRNYSTGTVTFTYPRDTVPPGNVLNFTASPGAGLVNLSWSNPTDSDYAGVDIHYSSTTFCPIPQTSATLLISSPATVTSYSHTGLNNNVTYYYTAYARDEVPNYAPGVNSTATPVSVARTLTVTHSTTPAKNVVQGSTNTVSDVLNLVASTETITVTGITIKKADTATASDEEISRIRLWNDIGTSTGVYDAGDGLLGTAIFIGGATTFSLNLPVSTDTTSILIAFDVSTSAVHNHTIITRLANQADITVSPPDVVGAFSDYNSNTFTIIDVSSPSNVTVFVASANVVGNRIDLSWVNVGEDQAGTMIRFELTPPGPTSYTDGTLLISSPVAVTNYSHLGLTDGTTYYYTAFAYDLAFNYSTGTTTSTYPRDTLAPGNVTAFTCVAVSSGNQIDLSWTNIGGDQAGTMIRYSTTSAPASATAGTHLISSPTTVSTYQHINLQDNLTYYYTAFAYDEVYNYASGVSTSTYPRDTLAPDNLIFFGAQALPEGNKISLTWSTATITDYSGARIRYRTDGIYPANASDGTLVGNFPASTTSYLHPSLTDGVTYYYKAFAYDEVPNYSTGTVTSTYPRDTLPPANVTAFTCVAVSSGNQIDLFWTNIGGDQAGTMIRFELIPPGPTSYTDGTFLVSLSTPAGTHSHTGLTDGVTYYYTAFAYDEVYNYATGVSTSTYPRDTIAPAAVTNLLVELTYGTSVQLLWNAPGDNGSTGTITNGGYWVKYSSAVATINDSNWASISGEVIWSTNTAPGNTERRIIPSLQSDTTYYFALKTRDEAYNWSYVSNCATGTTRDITAPGKIEVISASTGPAAGQINLTWYATGDDGNSGQIINGKFHIQYSMDPSISWKYDDAQIKISTSNVNPNDPQSYLVDGLAPGVTYYFRLWTADEVPNWSPMSNGATSYATPSPAPVTLYPLSTFLSYPFPTSSVKFSTAPGVTQSLLTKIKTDTVDSFYQFFPEGLGSDPSPNLPSYLTQYGWIYDVSQIYKTLHSGGGIIRVGWQADSPLPSGRLCYRVSKVTASGGQVSLVQTLKPWTVDDSTQPISKTLGYYSLTFSVSSSTFLSGEYLMVELGAKLVGGGGSGKYWYLETNTGNEYYTTPDWRDITPPAPITNLVATSSTTKGTTNLTWTAPGNNASSGTASYYEIRYADNPGFIGVLTTTTSVGGAAGTPELRSVGGLTAGTTWYFKVRTNDGAEYLENWSPLSNGATVYLPYYTHSIGAYNSAPIHQKMNEGKKDDLLKITIKNNNPLGCDNIYLSSVTVKFTSDGSSSLTTSQAKNLFNAIYLFLDTGTADFYHYAVDTSTVAILPKASFNLVSGEQTIGTIDSSARYIAPGGTKKYFLVVELSSYAASGTFAASISAVSKVSTVDYPTLTSEAVSPAVTYPVNSSVVTAITPATRRSGTSWPRRIDTGAAVKSIPLLYWDKVYVGADDNKLYCFDSSGTTKNWEFTANEKIRTAPFPGYNQWNEEMQTGEKTIYFTDEAGNIYKIQDATDTAVEVWKRTDISAAPGSWIGYDLNVQYLFVGSTDTRVYKLNSNNGSNAEYWTFDVSVTGSLSSTPAVDDYSGVNGLWIGSTGGRVYRMNIANGTVTSSFDTGSLVDTSPNLVDGYSIHIDTAIVKNLYFTSTNGKLYCRVSSNLFSRPAGWPESDFDCGSPIHTNPVFSPYEGATKFIYFGADNGKLYKINAETGQKIWEYQTDGKIHAGPMYDPGSYATYGDEYIYFASDDGYIYCLTPGGALRTGWPVQTGAEVRGSPMIDGTNRTLTIGSNDGNVYQIDIGPPD